MGLLKLTTYTIWRDGLFCLLSMVMMVTMESLEIGVASFGVSPWGLLHPCDMIR
jgi:hypothetical protein